ncbi:hypothetical protein F5Y19DRAFT_482350 [Xylariaceae sp. FL1651]|nr:hypothetical protein F5Y19DRAFT_482350 [Xylariaceae sp. FL1651]
MEFPRRDPKFYNDPLLTPNKPSIPQNGIELDRLFISEDTQREKFHGLQSWQVAPLNSWLCMQNQAGAISGGHLSSDDPSILRAMFERDKFEIDETRWFHFLQKSRWYDLVDHPNHKLRPVPRGGPWSVDNAKVWDILRVSLELADRIFKALITDRHSALETLLFGRIQYWDSIGPYAATAPFKDAIVLISPAMEAIIAAKQGSQPFQSDFSKIPEVDKTTALEVRLEALSDRQIWSFIAEPDPGAGWGATWKYREEAAVSGLITDMVRHLYGDDLTLAERCLLQFQLTTTIVHEAMHSIIDYRYYLVNAAADAREPFIDFEAAAEIGEAMEQRIFGGRVIVRPTANSTPICTNMMQWPTVYTAGARNNKAPVFQNGHPITVEYLTAMQAARLFSAEFWNDPNLPRKSDRFFHRTGMFRSTNLSAVGPPTWGLPKTWTEIEVDETNKALWRPYDDTVVAAWRIRQQEWALNRQNWYDVHKQRWLITPWGYSFRFRLLFDRFARFFEKKDEFECNSCSYNLVRTTAKGPIDWTNKTNFLDAMPTSIEITNEWIYFTIGLLMFAAMPVRNFDYLEKDTDINKIFQFTFTPSTDAMRLLQMGRKAPTEFRVSNPYDGILPLQGRAANALFDPFNQNGTEVKDPTQMDYLNVADKILECIRQRRAIVSGPWYRAIQWLLRDLKKQRQEIIDEYPQLHVLFWAKRWYFRIPDYDPDDQDWMQWVEATQEWRHFRNRPSFI